MNKIIRAALVACSFSALFAQPALATIIIQGFTFDDTAFVDTVVSTSGSVSFSGSDLLSSISGTDLFTRIHIPTDPTFHVELGFTDNLVINGPGVDLVLFELARPEDFAASLSISGSSIFVPTTAGCCRSDGLGLNIALIDLSDLGVSVGDTIDSIVLMTGKFGSGPDLAVVGALNSVAVSIPEPSTLTLFATGLAGLGFMMRRRRRST